MPPQNSKHFHVPFGKYANCVNHPGVADIEMQPKFPKFLLDMRYFCNFLLVSLGIRPRTRQYMRNGHGRARGVGAAPRRRRWNEAIFDREFQFRESHTSAETRKNPGQIPDTKEGFYIYLY